MKAITLLACTVIVLFVATLIKGCMNESTLAANQDGGLPSGSIARSKKDGLFIRQYNVEQINLTSSDINMDFKEAWLERLAEDEYECYWMHKRIPMNGQQIVLVRADGIAGDLTLWLEGAGRGFARSRSLYYSGSLQKVLEAIKLTILQDGHKEPCGYIILRPSDWRQRH